MNTQATRIKQLIHKTLEEMKKYPEPCVQKERLEQNLTVLNKALLRYEPKPKVSEAKKKETPPPPPVKKETPPPPVKKETPPPPVKKVVKKKTPPPTPKPTPKPTPPPTPTPTPKPTPPPTPTPTPTPTPQKVKKTLLKSGKIKPEVVVKKEVEKEVEGSNSEKYDLEFMTVEDLRKLVTQNHLFRGLSRMKKEDLIKGIRKSEWWRKGGKKVELKPKGVAEEAKKEAKNSTEEVKTEYVYNPNQRNLSDAIMVKMSIKDYEKLVKKNLNSL
jgi:hypothetical protein